MNHVLSYPMKLIAKNAGVSGSVLLKRWAIALPHPLLMSLCHAPFKVIEKCVSIIILGAILVILQTNLITLIVMKWGFKILWPGSLIV